MISYPTTLPCPTSKASQQSDPTFNRSEFDFAVRQRALPSSGYTLGAQFYIKSKAQMAEFREFYHTQLFGGVRSFLATWDIEGSSVEKEFRFSKIYSVAPKGAGTYEVGASFDMLTNIKDL